MKLILKPFFYAALLASFAGSALGQTWNGTTGQWNDASRWDPADVPNSAAAVVTVGSGTAIINTGLTSVTVGTLNLGGTVQLGQFTAGKSLTVQNDVTGTGDFLLQGVGNSLTLNGASSTTGSVALSNSAVLSVGTGGSTSLSGNLTAEASSIIGGAGNLTVAGTANLANITINGSGTLTLNGNTNFNSTSTAFIQGSRTVTTNGATTWNAQGDISLSNTARWDNSGALTATPGLGTTALILGADTQFNNLLGGTFVKTGGNNLTLSGAGVFNNAGGVESTQGNLLINTAFNNNNGGTVTASAGNITFGGAFTNTGGSVIANTGQQIVFNSTFDQTGGSLLVNGTTTGTALSLSNNATVSGNGLISQAATLVNSTLSPGTSIGTITFGSSLTMTGGVLDIEVGGALPGETDLIILNGTGTFTNVAVNATLFGGFQPAFVGEEFTFLRATNAADIIGQLSLTPSSLSNFSGFSLTTAGNGINLISAVPEPSSLALLGLCTGLGLFARKRRGAASV